MKLTHSQTLLYICEGIANYITNIFMIVTQQMHICSVFNYDERELYTNSIHQPISTYYSNIPWMDIQPNILLYSRITPRIRGLTEYIKIIIFFQVFLADVHILRDLKKNSTGPLPNLNFIST